MTKKKPAHNFRNSTYKRKKFEQYFTAPWITFAFLNYFAPDVAASGLRVLEPFAGRGDMAKVMLDAGLKVDCMDIDDSQYLLKKPKLTVQNFLDLKPSTKFSGRYGALVTNPPYGGNRVVYRGKSIPRAEAMVRHALTLDIPYVAMLLRSDFRHASGRTDLFTDSGYGYAYDVALTSRPRWDWWIPFTEVPKEDRKTPMHNYSWFVWDKNWERPSTTFYAKRPKDSLDGFAEPATDEFDI